MFSSLLVYFFLHYSTVNCSDLYKILWSDISNCSGALTLKNRQVVYLLFAFSARIVQPPKGGVRIPNVMPRNKGAKEKDKLSIDMVGPRTRSNLVEPISPLGSTRRRHVHVELTAKIGPDHQVFFCVLLSRIL